MIQLDHEDAAVITRKPVISTNINGGSSFRRISGMMKSGLRIRHHVGAPGLGTYYADVMLPGDRVLTIKSYSLGRACWLG